jgi:sugar transferase (PEP-CTERM/EpsH1 system associated)
MPRPRLLLLSHRIPYPPDKGEKIRAWHMLDHLAGQWEIDAGFLIDDRADLPHLPILEKRCRSVAWQAAWSRPGVAARALLRARPGQPLTLGWFHDPRLAAWVRAGIVERRWDAAFVYSSAMAPYLMRPEAADIGRRVLDLVDVDSEKWRAYAAQAQGLMRLVWGREARTLLAFERRAVASFDRTLLVSKEEAERFAELAPECAPKLGHIDNGVDMARFDPALPWPSPFKGRPGPAIVFTGTMSYRPNIEAVIWFAEQVMPRLRDGAGQDAAPEFHIVGANPSPAVLALRARQGVHVTGAIPDVRPYLAHAALAVAPLRIARGIQNKVLEAMAMARPVVASPEAFAGVRAEAGRDLLVAEGVEETVRRVKEVLGGEHAGLGPAARQAVARGHDWKATLRALDDVLSAPARAPHIAARSGQAATASA